MYILKIENNDIKHVINVYIELKDKLINELNKLLDKKMDKSNNLEKIEYFNNSKNYSEKKEEKKKDNKEIKLIKTFKRDMYFKFGETNNKKDK